jgi:DNA-binding CsgD family transcriptional regulator
MCPLSLMGHKYENFPDLGGAMRFQDKQDGVLPLISSYFPHELLLSALDDSKIGVVICDRRLRFKALNQSLAKMNNVPMEAHLGHSLHQILGSFAENLVPLYERVFATGHPSTDLEVTGHLPKRSGAGRWITNLFPLNDGSGRLRLVGCFVVEMALPSMSNSLPSNPIGKSKLVIGNEPSSVDRCQRRLLSHREQEVLRLLAEGKSNKEISSVLGISSRTVETYRARLMLKLDANSIVHLVQYAIRNHILTA